MCNGIKTGQKFTWFYGFSVKKVSAKPFIKGRTKHILRLCLRFLFPDAIFGSRPGPRLCGYFTRVIIILPLVTMVLEFSVCFTPLIILIDPDVTFHASIFRITVLPNWFSKKQDTGGRITAWGRGTPAVGGRLGGGQVIHCSVVMCMGGGVK